MLGPMQSSPFVSVAACSMGQYLARALHSILRQSYQSQISKYEIVASSFPVPLRQFDIAAPQKYVMSQAISFIRDNARGESLLLAAAHVSRSQEQDRANWHAIPSEDVLTKKAPPCAAICTTGELFGGVERHVLGLLAGLRTQELETILVLFADGELAVQARAQGIEPIILSSRNLSIWRTSRQLAQLFDQRQAHVVHVHGYKASVFCALARVWCRVRLVKTEHGLPETVAAAPIGTWRNRFYYWLDEIATRSAVRTVCYVTADLQSYHQRVHSGLQTIVIPNGVGSMDRQHFPRPEEMREEWFNLLIVGRLDSVKGHHVALEALAAEDMPSSIHLHIVGIGPRESELRALSERLRLSDQVHFLGFRRNIYDYIAHCRALLMPSLHEGLPYTLLEAMSLGIPILASRVGGLAEVLEDERTGLFFPPGDVERLTQLIRLVHSQPQLCERLGEQAREMQRARFSLEVMTERYMRIYREALAEKVG